MEIAPLFLVLVVHFFVVQMLLCGSGSKAARCNTMIKLDSPKVVDKVTPKFKDGKIVMCRCWKSKSVRFVRAWG